MRRRSAALLTAYVVVLGACGPPASEAVDTTADEQAIRAISMRWLELERNRDAAGIAALFASDGIAYRQNSEPAVGTAAIQAYMGQAFQENPGEQVEWTIDRIDVAASGDLAAEYGTWTESSSGPAGTGSDRGRYMTVYQKIGGEWKIVADMSVSTQPAEAPSS